MHYAYFVLVTTNVTCFFFFFFFLLFFPPLFSFFCFRAWTTVTKRTSYDYLRAFFLITRIQAWFFFIPIPPFSTLVSKNSVLEEDRHNRWQRSAFGNSMRACLARCFDQRATVIVVVHLFMEKRKKRGIFCEIIRSKLNRVITTFTPISKIASLRFFFIFF